MGNLLLGTVCVVDCLWAARSRAVLPAQPACVCPRLCEQDGAVHAGCLSLCAFVQLLPAQAPGLLVLQRVLSSCSPPRLQKCIYSMLWQNELKTRGLI